MINKIKEIWHNFSIKHTICLIIKCILQYAEFVFMCVIWCSLVLMLIAFIGLMRDATILDYHIPTLLYDWLGTKENETKYETLRFIGFGIGGVLATVGAVAFNRRATAQIEAAKAQTRHNELIEEGHNNERLQNMTANLGHDRMTVRITTFHQLYYLALKDKDKDKTKAKRLMQDVFETLCLYLRAMPDEAPDLTKQIKHEYLKERQTLFDILFKDKFKSNNNGLMSDDFPADLQKFNLAGIDLVNANLSSTNLSAANLSNMNLSYANLSSANLEDANLANVNLYCANIVETNLSRANLAGANLEDANLTNANVSMANLSGVNLSDANLSGADISNAYLIEADLSNARFSEKGFIRLDRPTADLSSSNFSHANLSGTNFIGVQLEDAKLQDVYSIEKANFLYAKMGDRVISPEDLPTDKGKYIAAWTNDEFWAEVEKNEES